MALTKHGIRANGLPFFRDQIVERERGEEKREEEEEEEEKKRRSQDQAKRYGTTKFDYGYLGCMIIILPKPRVLQGFHLNPKIMESKVGKTPYDTRWL